MKLKISEESLCTLEDALLDLFFGLDIQEWEGSPELRIILDQVQDKMYGEQL